MENQPQNNDDATDNNRRDADDPVPDRSAIIPNYPKYEHWYADTADYEAEETGYWRRQNKISTWAVVINGCTLVAAIVAGCVAYNAFVQTKRQADAAISQVQTAKETEHKQLRAYVSAKVSPKGITNFVPDQIAELEISIQNSGQTPALDLISNAILFLRKYPLAETEDLTIPGTPTKTALGLGVTIHPRDIDVGTTLKRKIEPAIYEGLKITDTARFYAFGVILYLDIFGVQHWTHFCYNFYGTGPTVMKWEACARYNDTDKNE